MAPQRTDNLVTPAVSAPTRVQRGRTSFQGASLARVPDCRVLRTRREWRGGVCGGVAGRLARGSGAPWRPLGWWRVDSGFQPRGPPWPRSLLSWISPKLPGSLPAAGLMPLIHSRIATKVKNTDLGHSLPTSFFTAGCVTRGK